MSQRVALFGSFLAWNFGFGSPANFLSDLFAPPLKIQSHGGEDILVIVVPNDLRRIGLGVEHQAIPIHYLNAASQKASYLLVGQRIFAM